MTTAHTTDPITDTEEVDVAVGRSIHPPVVFAIWLIIAGVIGWFAAFALTLEKFEKLVDPGVAAGCDFSVIVQCSANLESWQGSVFGFPNPILGLACWIAPIVVGAALLARARFAKWFWALFWVGFVFAIGFVVWLISQSIFVLGTLCPWCMVTWSVTIPSFFAVTFHVMREGVFGDRLRAAGDRLISWTPVFAIVCFAIIAVMAQLRLNFLATL
ncbi:vitamin K epoxide reductase family protein [Microbacterium gorillae]|uniref:vitamin K epoxide reductase family protein n=1 Tax=Microbacterium gorillae TaxID=1231063 RepID=UPI000A7F7FBA|nr:vitamin K epoxide reductase family protein [Microbacterium gorillae]